MYQNEQKIKRLFDYLDDINMLLDKFKRKHGFLERYLSIEGRVTRRGGSINISCHNELDKLTVLEIKNVIHSLEYEICGYLCDNDIEYTLVLKDKPSTKNWAKNGTDIIFEIQR